MFVVDVGQYNIEHPRDAYSVKRVSEDESLIEKFENHLIFAKVVFFYLLHVVVPFLLFYGLKNTKCMHISFMRVWCYRIMIQIICLLNPKLLPMLLQVLSSLHQSDPMNLKMSTLALRVVKVNRHQPRRLLPEATQQCD